ncbi:hypothetical protein D477_009775 [Arthrobacter crystallopoietes BAB-32]|uniref:Uncharacterized protein n=1 Tax=Arthrobacter crystallopoietes BAB-32 TaxID=1246476 RepID=N1V837_9MICC|nr:hypothetical protein [Arthrobacter crystallopoietes]EMY34408.1 hypothetical protein D477_009775 [Arthrobacter crystallopoietes BAB-32]
MKPLDTAVRPAPEQSIRPEPSVREQDVRTEQTVRAGESGRRTPASHDRTPEHRGELITAGSLDGIDGSGSTGPAMPNYLEREEVNAVIRKLRQSYSFWKRIQSVTIDEQKLEEARDELLAYRQLIR